MHHVCYGNDYIYLKLLSIGDKVVQRKLFKIPPSEESISLWWTWEPNKVPLIDFLYKDKALKIYLLLDRPFRISNQSFFLLPHLLQSFLMLMDHIRHDNNVWHWPWIKPRAENSLVIWQKVNLNFELVQLMLSQKLNLSFFCQPQTDESTVERFHL